MSGTGQRHALGLRLPVALVSGSEAGTEAAGAALAPHLVAGDVVALSGPLGAGKTCFTRGLVRGLGARDQVASPTFALVREYAGRTPVRHVDLYRLEPAEVRELDWRDLFYGPGVAVVEWADKAEVYLPEDAYRVTITPDLGGDPGRRVIDISRPGGAPTLSRPAAKPGAAEAPAPVVTVFRTRCRVPAAAPSRVLAIDTSTSTRSLAVLAGDEMHEMFWGVVGGSAAAEDLSDGLRQLLSGAGLGPRDIRLIAVALGPGSFTGIKVGLASAKALAYALGCPVKGVGTLDVLAAGAFGWDDGPGWGDGAKPSAVLSLIDARRGEVFGAAYLGAPEPLPDRANRSYLVGPARDVVAGLLATLGGAAGRIVVTGDGAGDGLEPGLLRGPQHPKASDLALLAQGRFAAGARDDPFLLQPLYLREPDINAPGRPGGGPK